MNRCQEGKRKKAAKATGENNGELREVAGFRPRKQKKKLDESSMASGNAMTDEWVGLPCPVCHEGRIIKGNTAYGCSRWKEGCTFRRKYDDK